jgi:pimeloyl-ACP methyl ester carboxylesterase
MRKALMMLIALPALAYLGLCGLMYARQREMMYFPQLTQVEPGRTNFELARDGATLRGWVLNPGQRDAVLYFGGNAEAVQEMRAALAGWFPDRTVYLLAYRGYGASDGAPEEGALFADALALFDHARSEHGDGRVGLVGRSLGSGVASYVASQRPADRLVLVTPFDSLADVAAHHYPWLPVGLLVKDRYDSLRHLQAYRGPVLVIRAGRDRVVPPASTDRLVAGLPARPRVLAVDAADHDSIFDSAEPGREIVTFFDPRAMH